MSSSTKTIPWKCPQCKEDMSIPIDILNNGESVSCTHCSFHGVLVKPTIPFKCVRCLHTFNVLESTRTLGGTAQCPFCHQRYRRASRKIIEDVTQDHGRLIPIR